MAYQQMYNSKNFPRVRATRVTAGETWAHRNDGGVISRVVMTYTADGTLILSTKDNSAEASIVFQLQVSAGANQRWVECLVNHAGDLYVHTLTAKNLLSIQYE